MLIPPPRTSWPPGLLQDDCKALAQWFASRPYARREVRVALSIKVTKDGERVRTEELGATREVISPGYSRLTFDRTIVVLADEVLTIQGASEDGSR